MYDEDYTTANSAEKWLSFYRWLNGKVQEMNDDRLKGLEDFAFGYKQQSERESMPDYPQERYARVHRQQQKAVSQGTVANVYVFVDEAGNMTQQSDRHHFFIPAASVAAYRALIDSLVPMPDPAVIDINTQNVVPGNNGQSQNTPQTNSQMSEQQNMLVAKYLKSKR